MPLHSFPKFKLVLSRHKKELRGAPKAWGPRPWPICPMRKSVTGCGIFCRKCFALHKPGWFLQHQQFSC